MKRSRHAFTLAEILVAMAIFVSITLLGTMAVASFQRIGRQARQSLTIHAKAEAVSRFLQEQLQAAMTQCALWQGKVGEQDALVFMRTLHHNGAHWDGIEATDLARIGLGSSSGAKAVDIQWSIIAWNRDGQLLHGVSVPPPESRRINGPNWISVSTRDESTRGFYSTPTPQSRISFLLGRSDVPPDPGQPYRRGGFLSVLEFTDLGAWKDEDDPGDPGYLSVEDEHFERCWFGSALSTGFFGSRGSAIADAYAVANPDGRSWNKDWMALVGSSDSWHFPDQRFLLHRDVEFVEIAFYDRHGRELDDEDDDLGDGPDSSDWLGLPHNGVGSGDPVRRPAAIGFTYLLHAVPNALIDDDDLDDDGEVHERLVDAVRDRIQAIPDLSPAERRALMRDDLEELGFLGQVFEQRVELPL